MEKAFQLMKFIKAEPPVSLPDAFLFYLVKPRPKGVVRVNWLCLKVIGALME